VYERMLRMYPRRGVRRKKIGKSLRLKSLVNARRLAEDWPLIPGHVTLAQSPPSVGAVRHCLFSHRNAADPRNRATDANRLPRSEPNTRRKWKPPVSSRAATPIEIETNRPAPSALRRAISLPSRAHVALTTGRQLTNIHPI
jgi:hypothetical protein